MHMNTLLNMEENNTQEHCHGCGCEAHCDQRLCGGCKDCPECACWPCHHSKNHTIFNADLMH